MYGKKSKIHPLPCGRSVEEIALWLYREVKQEKSKVALLGSLDRMTGLSIPREIKERIISESDLDEMIDWKQPLDPGEVRDCLKATRQIVEGILTPEEYDYQSEDPDVEGIHSFDDLFLNEGAIVHLYDRLYDDFQCCAITGCLESPYFSQDLGHFFDYDEYIREDNWKMDPGFDPCILEPMSRDIFWRILVRLGYDRDIDPDSIAGLTKWGFLNGFTSFLFESWIPEMLLSAIQEREDNYQRLKKALEDMYGADVVVPDLESILRNKQEWSLSYEYVVGELRLQDLVDIKRYFGANFEEETLARRLLDFSRLLECSLPPNSKILEMLTDPAWLAKFPSVQSYLETEDIDRLREGLVRGVHECISMGISEVDLSYTTHPQVSALFDMSSQQGRRRRKYVRNLVAKIFKRVSNPLGNKKRCRSDDVALITLKCKRNAHGVKIYYCPECRYSSGGPKMVSHIIKHHPSLVGELRLLDLVDIKRCFGANFEKGTYEMNMLDFQSAFLLECSLLPNSKILEMLTDPAWLAKFPSVQSYLETEVPFCSVISEDIHQLRQCLVRGVHKCISMGISEVDLSYTTHPQVSALFDMSCLLGRRRRNYVRNLVAIIFEGVSNRLGKRKRRRSENGS
ncbi:hypothetical protein M9434_000788 [Picochlorum sp. BPE23]|nr:hypothetical protein M9434_000788 [Picochlorum sp. BPE23]